MVESKCLLNKKIHYRAKIGPPGIILSFIQERPTLGVKVYKYIIFTNEESKEIINDCNYLKYRLNL